MIVLHHLENSRSQRILWLLEELGVKYEIRRYARDAKTRLAPPELQAIHALGKSPVITDGKLTVAESGAIVEYLIRRYGRHKLMPSEHGADFVSYLQWMHYAEGSAVLPVMLALYVGRLGEAGAPLQPRIQSELANHFGYIDSSLQGRDFLVGKSLTGADIQMSFVLEAAEARGRLKDYPNAARYLAALKARPAYNRALERGGGVRPEAPGRRRAARDHTSALFSGVHGCVWERPSDDVRPSSPGDRRGHAARPRGRRRAHRSGKRSVRNLRDRAEPHARAVRRRSLRHLHLVRRLHPCVGNPASRREKSVGEPGRNLRADRHPVDHQRRPRRDAQGRRLVRRRSVSDHDLQVHQGDADGARPRPGLRRLDPARRDAADRA